MPTSSYCTFLVWFPFFATGFGNLKSMASQVELDPVFVPCVSHARGRVVPKGTVVFLALRLLPSALKTCRRAAAMAQAPGERWRWGCPRGSPRHRSGPTLCLAKLQSPSWQRGDKGTHRNSFIWNEFGWKPVSGNPIRVWKICLWMLNFQVEF